MGYIVLVHVYVPLFEHIKIMNHLLVHGEYGDIEIQGGDYKPRILNVRTKHAKIKYDSALVFTSSFPIGSTHFMFRTLTLHD